MTATAVSLLQKWRTTNGRKCYLFHGNFGGLGVQTSMPSNSVYGKNEKIATRKGKIYRFCVRQIRPYGGTIATIHFHQPERYKVPFLWLFQ